MTYFSVDVETTGLNPLLHDVTALSVVEVESEESFSCTLEEPDWGFFWDLDTKYWYNANVPASVNNLPLLSPYKAVGDLGTFLAGFPGPYTFVAWPVSFDYPMLQTVYVRAGLLTTPFHYRTVDVKSWIAGAYGVSIDAKREEIEKIAPGLWIEPEEPHNPYNDALAQARTFKKLLEIQKGMENLDGSN